MDGMNKVQRMRTTTTQAQRSQSGKMSDGGASSTEDKTALFWGRFRSHIVFMICR